MRICRFQYQGQLQVGLYSEEFVVPFGAAAQAYQQAHDGHALSMPLTNNLLDYLPPAGPGYAGAQTLAAWIKENPTAIGQAARLAVSDLQLLVPIPKPNKLFLLAGNYAAHIEEGGGHASERAETFPYVFMKPPTTTLTHPGQPVTIPALSPKHIDWELELAVVIGRHAKGVAEKDALDVVAGYTVINDISNRKFRPNPARTQRDKDGFFDWLHGKWFDSFCPCGPCITSADEINDPQRLAMKLSLNGEVRQDGSTAQQIFPVAAVIEFISSFVTLEPGDIISTGTPAGVGNTTGTYVKDGDTIEAGIESIGTLVTPFVLEQTH